MIGYDVAVSPMPAPCTLWSQSNVVSCVDGLLRVVLKEKELEIEHTTFGMIWSKTIKNDSSRPAPKAGLDMLGGRT